MKCQQVPLLQSDVVQLEDAPPGRQYAVVSHHPRGEHFSDNITTSNTGGDKYLQYKIDTLVH